MSWNLAALLSREGHVPMGPDSANIADQKSALQASRRRVGGYEAAFRAVPSVIVGVGLSVLLAPDQDGRAPTPAGTQAVSLASYELPHPQDVSPTDFDVS